jgi:hypothetical protein
MAHIPSAAYPPLQPGPPPHVMMQPMPPHGMPHHMMAPHPGMPHHMMQPPMYGHPHSHPPPMYGGMPPQYMAPPAHGMPPQVPPPFVSQASDPDDEIPLSKRLAKVNHPVFFSLLLRPRLTPSCDVCRNKRASFLLNSLMMTFFVYEHSFLITAVCASDHDQQLQNSKSKRLR